MKKIYVNHKTPLTQSCGVTEIGYFRRYQQQGWYPTIQDLEKPAGAGWFLASFSNNPIYEKDYKEAYEQLKKKYKIVYQSPVRVNTRTNRKFFFCIYDITQKGD